MSAKWMIAGLILITAGCSNGERPGPGHGFGAPPPRSGEGRPPPGRLFISPMGEPFRTADPVRAWFDGADANRDGALSGGEFEADAARVFALLDRGKDGEIDPDDIAHYESVLAPEIRAGGPMMGMMRGRGGGGRGKGGKVGGMGGGGMGGGGMGGGSAGGGGAGRAAGSAAQIPQGAARFGFLGYPQPVTAADRNLNRGVDPQEFERAADERFALLDTNRDGKLGFDELPRLASPMRRR